MDWGLFHVKQPFLDMWRGYCRALGQRNALLRHGSGGSTLDSWNHELERMAVEIDEWRSDYISSLRAHFLPMLAALLDLTELSMEYQRGWPLDTSLTQHLQNKQDRDLGLGYTRDGPHTADLLIKVAGVPTQECASRGQQKLIISALYRSEERRVGKECRSRWSP